ncbi:MAG TPA: TlyA family RNA methyltransferase [Candidatus Akkermansia intestinigallinarum]|uniref:TlyA family RNA methyltransferase n=1 Tax=Candidatus Akkermansia intestinigallinarum TaxID=2838431 RepID=A0A9D1VAS7_9BACT|nr:TlyA family RNA methyltransferase [Candidatus Akkermansia intestinigallinarum]
MPKQRLDLLLVSRGLVDSREQAQRLILAGEVLVKDQPVTKPGTKVDDDLPLTVKNRPKYVSRGGLKLEGALQAFPVKAEGKICLDIGSSTGGFTDCLLQNGALRVHAVDVGTNQLVWKLRSDPRVIVKEQFNARYMTPADLGEKVQLIVSDVSFISLTKILPAAYDCLEEGGDMLVLIKPQFELQPEDIGPGGIVRDPALHRRAVEKIRLFVTEELHREWMGVADSPIKGMEGNKEFLAWLR